MAAQLVSVTVPPGDLAKLDRLIAAIRAAGSKDLANELNRGLRRAVRPMQKTFRQGAFGFLPHRGGLAELVAADMRFKTDVSVSSSPRLRITGSLPGHDLNAMNRGRLRHPTFGHRNGAAWVTQQIRPNWWDDTGVLAAQDAGDEISNAIDRVAAKLEAAA